MLGPHCGKVLALGFRGLGWFRGFGLISSPKSDIKAPSLLFCELCVRVFFVEWPLFVFPHYPTERIRLQNFRIEAYAIPLLSIMLLKVQSDYRFFCS